MTSNDIPPTNKREQTLQIHGETTTQELLNSLQTIDPELTIQSFEITLLVGQDTGLPSISLPSESEGKQTQPPEQSHETATEDEVSQENQTTSDTPPDLPLRPGHDPYYALLLLYDQDDWTRTKDLKEAIPDSWDLNPDTLGTVLWDLNDQGFVNKRKYEPDKRQKEYTLSDEGQHVIEKAIEYADDEHLPEELALPNV